MRVLHLVPAALWLLTSVPLVAQEPFDYVSKQDYFSINMPKEPKVEQTTYPDEYRIHDLGVGQCTRGVERARVVGLGQGDAAPLDCSAPADRIDEAHRAAVFERSPSVVTPHSFATAC